MRSEYSRVRKELEDRVGPARDRPLHGLLEWQLKRLVGSSEIPERFREFLDAVNEAYKRHDEDLEVLERSIEVAAHELREGNRRLREDIEKRQRVEAQLQQRTSELEAIFQALPDQYFRMDSQSRVLDYKSGQLSDPCAASDGYIGKRLVDAFPSDAGGLIQESIRHVIRTGDAATIEYTLPHEMGAQVYEARIARYMQDQVISLVRNVTEKRRLQEQLIFSDRLAAMGTLSAGMAHEINNPLAYVITNLEFAASAIRQGSQSPESIDLTAIAEALAEALQGAGRVRSIVRDLKAFSRDEGTNELRPVDVRAVLDSAVNIARNELKHRAKLTKQFDSVPPVLGSEARLAQVFVNLLVNAAQALPEAGKGERKGEIKISVLSAELGKVQIEIRDSGTGIPAENLGRIFDPFFTTKPVGQGTGLGLAICHGIVTSLGGEIEVDSAVGVGTAFRITLPTTQKVAHQTRMLSSRPPPASRATILLVDDEPLIGKAFRRMLSQDYDIIVEMRPKDALNRVIAQEHIDVIVCDIEMPGMNGIELYEKIREQAPSYAQRVVFLTGGSFTPWIRSALEQVSNPRLDKPLDAARLRRALHDMIRKNSFESAFEESLEANIKARQKHSSPPVLGSEFAK